MRLYFEDPEKAHLWDSTAAGGPGPLPTLLLTSRGRKSGTQRHLPLIYGRAGDDYIVVASKGGAPQHPSWFLNLEATPECEIRVGADRLKARARVAEGNERQLLWEAMATIYPPYDAYRDRAGDRTIPVVVLEPTGSAG